MTLTITIDDAQYADGLAAFGTAENVAAKATADVAHQRLNWRDAAEQVTLARKLKLADALDSAKDTDTKAKIVAAVAATVDGGGK